MSTITSAVFNKEKLEGNIRQKQLFLIYFLSFYNIFDNLPLKTNSKYYYFLCANYLQS